MSRSQPKSKRKKPLEFLPLSGQQISVQGLIEAKDEFGEIEEVEPVETKDEDLEDQPSDEEEDPPQPPGFADYLPTIPEGALMTAIPEFPQKPEDFLANFSRIPGSNLSTVDQIIGRIQKKQEADKQNQLPPEEKQLLPGIEDPFITTSNSALDPSRNSEAFKSKIGDKLKLMTSRGVDFDRPDESQYINLRKNMVGSDGNPLPRVIDLDNYNLVRDSDLTNCSTISTTTYGLSVTNKPVILKMLGRLTPEFLARHEIKGTPESPFYLSRKDKYVTYIRHGMNLQVPKDISKPMTADEKFKDRKNWQNVNRELGEEIDRINRIDTLPEFKLEILDALSKLKGLIQGEDEQGFTATIAFMNFQPSRFVRLSLSHVDELRKYLTHLRKDEILMKEMQMKYRRIREEIHSEIQEQKARLYNNPNYVRKSSLAPGEYSVRQMKNALDITKEADDWRVAEPSQRKIRQLISNLGKGKVQPTYDDDEVSEINPPPSSSKEGKDKSKKKAKNKADAEDDSSSQVVWKHDASKFPKKAASSLPGAEDLDVRLKWENCFNQRIQRDERLTFLLYHGINEVDDPLLKYYSDGVWFSGSAPDLYVHRHMGCEVLNRAGARLFGNLVSLEHDPFNPDMRLSKRMQYVLMKLIKKLRTWIQRKICKEIEAPTSSITYLESFDEREHATINLALNDERCESLNKKRQMGDGILRDYIFLTPHFHSHFEFTRYQEIRDVNILRYKVKFAANQLGFDPVQINLKQKVWHPVAKFSCPAGFADWHSFYFRDDEKLHDYQPCPFFIRYQRSDDLDENSPYTLVSFDMIHSHPLCLRIYEKVEMKE